MLAARITFAHFSVSSTISLPKSAGEPGSVAAPMSTNRALIFASESPALISLLSLSMISAGVGPRSNRDRVIAPQKQRLLGFGLRTCQVPDGRQLAWLLGASPERPRDRHATDNSDELAPSHWVATLRSNIVGLRDEPIASRSSRPSLYSLKSMSSLRRGL